MTNVEQLIAEMEIGEHTRRILAEDLVRLRRLERECRLHQRRLPPRVQAALRAPAHEYQLDPPPEPHTSARLV